MPKLIDLIKCIEFFAPLEYQEAYDNSGLTFGDVSADVTGVLTSLEINENVIDEAVSNHCNLIITHHPLIFNHIKNINTETIVGISLLKAIYHKISIYVAHTNLDNTINGVSWALANILNMRNVSVLREKIDTKSNDKENSFLKKIGTGIIGELKKSITEIEFLTYIKERLSLRCVRHSYVRNVMIKRIAICGGSGSSFIADAITKKADAMITADINYHTFFDKGKDILLADIGHYESEIHTKELLSSILLKSFNDIKIIESKVNTNPVFYFN